MRRARLTLKALGALVPALVLAGCSSGGGSDADSLPTAVVTAPPQSAFSAGDCQTVAPALLEAGRTLGALAEEPPNDALLQRVAASQAALTQLQVPTITAPVEELVTGLGFVRLRTASGTYGSDLRDSVLERYTALVVACTGPTPPTAAPTTRAPIPTSFPSDPPEPTVPVVPVPTASQG